jgi:hypothetical protein
MEGKPMIPPAPNTSGNVTLVTSDNLQHKSESHSERQLREMMERKFPELKDKEKK